MLSFDTRPAISLDRSAPIARWSWCWPALGSGVALVLDAMWPLMPDAHGYGVLWLDIAAVACLVWAATGRRRARLADWATPVDGRVLSGFMLAVLHVVRLEGAAAPVQWLHQIAAGGLCFYALAARLRRDTASADALWPVFALLALALSLVTLGPLTQGLDVFMARSKQVDARWLSEFGLGKTLLLVTVLCIGRASEPGARVFWRVTALVGGLSCVVHLFTNGIGLRVASLGNLDEPFYFGTSIVAFILLAGMSRTAWGLASERPGEAGRWRATAVMFAVLITLLLFGGTTGGEGVRAVAAIAGAAVVVAQVAPRAAARRSAPKVADAVGRAEPPGTQASRAA